MSSVKRCCFVALILATTGVQSNVQPNDVQSGFQPNNVQSQPPAAAPTTHAAAEDLVRSYGGSLCTNADSPGTCLFKGLLKGALLYVTRRQTAVAADKVGEDATTAGGGPLQQSKGIEEYLMEQVKNILGMFSFGLDLPSEITAPWSMLKSSFLDGRGKKNKNLGPMLAAGMVAMAGTLIPLAFGALAMLAGKAIMTSLLAITISGMLALKALFGKHEGGAHVYKAYSAPPAHYAEAQYEQEVGLYKGQTEAKMHSYYAGDSNLSAYYKGSEQQVNGSDQPEYYAGAGSLNPKFVSSGHRAHSDMADNAINANEKATVVVSNGNKIIAERLG